MEEEVKKSTREEEMEQRQAILKNLILRLHAGEDYEQIKKEFKEHFATVSALEISMMERRLIEQGIAVEEIQRLCSIHAALFADAVTYGQAPSPESEKPGHPIRVLKEENMAIEATLDRIARLLESYLGEPDPSLKTGLLKQLDILWGFDKHYTRKEYAIFPIMERYGMTAPPKVMWGVDDEIRGLYKKMKRMLEEGQLDALKVTFETLQQEMKEMFIKEEDILLPMVSDSFTEDDWLKIAAESDEIGYCIVHPEAQWQPERTAFETGEVMGSVPEGNITFGTGFLTVKELETMLNRLPLELTFIDADGIVKYYNDGPDEKIFMRTKSALGRDAENCHPPKSVAFMRQLVSDLKSGKKSHEIMWYEEGGKFIVVNYCALHDEDGTYLGVLEYVQEAQSIRELKGAKRHLS
ncbi:DUF438 domain-containing protein [Trichococcus collinsii]|uniref:Hemerythrin-like domain-containing protein n=1 Tax=Trichococcus collinsii TaxID=157076 RepID=A0AB37ZZU7_9LACT|nr:DUF438 domain-containing protein [Trichococcus collinsii]CZR08558.1 Hypothetical protein Tcol_2742 [Trichococcus collinsii]SEA20902.1 hypothetical protein SAMN04488525_102259 [Trichococcus collinsii]